MRTTAERDAPRKSLIHTTEAKKAFLSRTALKGLHLGSSLPGKGSHLVSSPSTPYPGTCNSESESMSAETPMAVFHAVPSQFCTLRQVPLSLLCPCLG